MSTFSEWLADTSKRRVLLADITAYSGGAEVTRRVASETFRTGSSDIPASTLYSGRIAGDPYFERQMSNAFYGRAFVSIGELELDNTDGDLDSWLDDAFDGRSIVLKLGDPDWSISQFQTILTGVIEGLDIKSDELLSVVIRSQMVLLDKPLTDILLTTGEREDQPEPFCIGYAYNIQPVLIDDATRKYKIDAGPVEDVCVQLYDKGKPSAISVTKDNANGEFTLASDPSGLVTCDAKGRKPSTWLETPGEILTEIVGSDATVDSSSMSALDTSAPYQLGIYGEGRENKLRLIESLIPAGWWWGDNRSGSIVADLLASPSGTPVMTIDANEIQGDGGSLQVEKLDIPAWRIRVGYQKNHNVNKNPDDTAATARKEFLKEEYRVSSAEDSSVKTTHLRALDPEIYESYITGSSDAATEASRLLTLFKTQRYLYTVDCFVGPYQLDIGDVVTLKDDSNDPRYGLGSGVDCVVVGISEYFLDNRVTLTLWR